MVKIIFFATLIIFPFGQLFKFGFVNLFDIAVLLLALLTLLHKPTYPSWFKYFIYFILFCLFSLVINYQFFELKSILYLARLTSYAFVAVYISNFVKQKSLILKYLLVASIASAIFGWIQYLIWPDLTTLKYFGWDDHLLRMTGTFLDPTFLGLVLVLGVIVALQKKNNLAFYFLALSILFTYSRISYLLLFLVSLLNKKYLGILIFVLVIVFLPKNIGEGTNFARTVSGNNKLENYRETFEIIKRSPLVGVGFNNICNARVKYLGEVNIDSHSCSGSDSSILFLLATTGIIGFILFIYFILQIPTSPFLTISFLAVLVHSIFANSLFYPHIMFWMFSLVGLGSKINGKGS
ncbi:MAG: hypothetical protein QY322_01165 [bacterium]|nr:MAG: hypothetical protein QY322_01165 [bacterium]